MGTVLIVVDGEPDEAARRARKDRRIVIPGSDRLTSPTAEETAAHRPTNEPSRAPTVFTYAPDIGRLPNRRERRAAARRARARAKR
jgi:hypothetical protein